MRVLITGGAGFIGSHLTERFLREGFQVRVLDSLESRIHPHGLQFMPPNVEFIRASITDERALSAALKDVDVVSHQAAYQDYMPDFSKFLSVNAAGTALLYELIVRHKFPIKKIIVASSQAVYGEGQYRCGEHGLFQPKPRSTSQLEASGWEIACPSCGVVAQPLRLCEEYTNPYNQYAVSKLAEERTALGLGWLHGIPTVALRYSITQGRRQSIYNHYSGICRIFCSRALQAQPLIIFEDGNQTRDFVHVDDVVDANMLVLEKSNADFEAYNVGSGQATTVLQYATAVQNAVGVPTPVQMLGAYRKGDNRHSVSSIAKIQQLGWSPRHGLEKILVDFLAWINTIGGIPGDIPDALAHMQREGVVCRAAAV